MKCPRCGSKNYNEAYYCRNCGLAMAPDIEAGENFALGNPRSFFGQDDNSQPAMPFTDENAQQSYERPDNDEEYCPPTVRYNKDESARVIYDVGKTIYARKMAQASIIIILVVVFCLAMVVFSAWCKLNNRDVLSMLYSVNQVQPLEIPTAPEVEIYAAKLSGSKQIVTSYTDENIAVRYPVPKRYVLEADSSENFALYTREFKNGTKAILSMVIFSGDVQKEVDYFENIQAEDGAPFDKEVTDTALGEMTLITLEKTSAGTTIYHAYVKMDNENYFHISLSNVGEEYKTEAKKLVNLIAEDSSFMNLAD